MKKLLTILLLISAFAGQSQNLPMFEGILPAIKCSSDKVTQFGNALEPMRKAGQVIYVLADANNKGNATDFAKRYTSQNGYFAGGTQQPRYNGLYGTPPSVGSLWADKVGWVTNLTTGTLLKANAMITEATNSGWNISSMYSTNGTQMSVVVNVLSKYPVPLSSLSVKCFLIDKTTHRFIQYIGSDGVLLGEMGLGQYKFFTLTGTVTATNYEVVVTVQDTKPFAPDGLGSDLQHLKQGDFERIILCSNYSQLSK